MELAWVLCIVLVFVYLDDVTAARVKNDRTGTACFGKFPEPFYKACDDCGLLLPKASARRKRAAKPAVEATPAPANITPAQRKAAKCVVEKLGLVDKEYKGVTYTKVRQYLDKNYAGSPKQKILWTDLKNVAEVASNKKRPGDAATNMFIDGVYHLHAKHCGS